MQTLKKGYSAQSSIQRCTVRSDVEERVAEEHLAWNDKNVPAWPKNISVLRILGPKQSAVCETRMW